MLKFWSYFKKLFFFFKTKNIEILDDFLKKIFSKNPQIFIIKKKFFSKNWQFFNAFII